jgi:DNA-binding transcriptional LysR family regulator
MSAAGRELSYSHSAISQQLALLEKEAGVVLLERVGRNVRLTAAGEGLVRNTEAILAAVERAESELARARVRPLGTVVVAAFATISRSAMPAALGALSREFPGLTVRLHLVDPQEAVLQLLSRRVHAVITDDYPGTEGVPAGGIHTTVLGVDPVRAYLPDPAVDGDLERIRLLSWVMEGQTTASTQWALRVCRERGFEPILAHESADLLFHLRMVEQGLAAAFLPDMLLRETGSPLTPSSWLPTDQHRSILFLVRDGAQNHPMLVAVREAVAAALSA